jgi:hypothetical protein
MNRDGALSLFALLAGGVAMFASSNVIDLQHQSKGIPILVGAPPNAKLVGNATSLTLEPGLGLGWACTPGPAMVCTAALGVQVATKTTIQGGMCDFINSTDLNSQYTYAFASSCQSLAAYQDGAHFLLRVQVTNGNGTCTLNIDNLGEHNIKDATGQNDPPKNFLVPGQFYPIAYDGKLNVFRLI